MNGKDYMQTQISMIEIGKHASLLDVDSFLETIANAETAGPIIDPTMYRKAMDNLSSIRQLAEAIKRVKEAHQNMVRTVLKTAARGHMETRIDHALAISDEQAEPLKVDPNYKPVSNNYDE